MNSMEHIFTFEQKTVFAIITESTNFSMSGGTSFLTGPGDPADEYEDRGETDWVQRGSGNVQERDLQEVRSRAALRLLRKETNELLLFFFENE